MQSEADRIGIIGIGNVLAGDDALGPYAVEVLRARWEWTDEVELIDAGTPGDDLAELLQRFRAAVVIDSVRTGAAPGTLVRLPREELITAPGAAGRTCHDPSLTSALLVLETVFGETPDVTLVGMVPGLQEGIGLSPAVRAALPGLLEWTLVELARLGISPRRREHPLPEKIWWEGQANRPGGN